MSALFSIDPNVVQNSLLTLEQKKILRDIVDTLNAAVDASATEADLAKLAAVTADAAELSIMDGVTASAAEINALDNATAANGTTGKVAILGTNGAITFAGALTTQAATLTSAGVGTKNGGTVTVVEAGDGNIHKSTFTLAGTPVVLTDDPSNGAYVGLKLYDFPAGNIISLGAAINADLSLSETWWVDNKGGDVGLGTVATAVGTALVNSTQNIIATTSTTSAAQVSTLDTQSTAVGTSGAAGGTDADIVLNFRIDDDILHFPDIITNGAFTTDTGWTKGTGWTIDAANSNKADCDGTQEAVSDLSQAPAPVTILAGISYILTFTTTRSAGTVTAVLGGTVGAARSTAETFVETLIAGGDGTLVFRADADFVGSIDTVSLTPTTGSGSVSGTVTVAWINAGDF